MSYSAQTCDGVIVENIDGRIFINRREVVDGTLTSRLSRGQPIKFFLLGTVFGTLATLALMAGVLA